MLFFIQSTEDLDIDDQSQNLKLKESLFSLVGKAWPYTLATQGNKFITISHFKIQKIYFY